MAGVTVTCKTEDVLCEFAQFSGLSISAEPLKLRSWVDRWDGSLQFINWWQPSLSECI